MAWVFEQSTGKLFTPTGAMLAIGYSGAPGAVNDPSKQEIENVGPIPLGLWFAGVFYDDPKTGPDTIPLTPAPETETFGRDEFKMHGDSIQFFGQQKASEGCIVMPRFARQQVNDSTDKHLRVVATYEPITHQSAVDFNGNIGGS